MLLQALLDNLYLPPAELRALQEEGLRRMVRHAAARSPYYRRLFAAAGLDPAAIRGLADLPRIPITSRATLQRLPQREWLAEGVDPATCHRESTSGTTGEPLTILLGAEEQRLRRALQGRTLWALGLARGATVARIGPLGRNQPPPERSRRRDGGLFGSVEISPFAPPAVQIEELKRARAAAWWIFPSLLRDLVDALTPADAAALQPELLLVGSALLPQLLRERVERLWPQTEIVVVYGANEVGRIAWECEEHAGLHVAADALLVETVRERPQAPPVVVVTSLYHRAMPLLRYRLGDVAELDPAPCRCGCAFPRLTRLEGRVEDFIALADGRAIAPDKLGLAMDELVAEEDAGIARYRIVQESLDRLVVQVVPTGDSARPLREVRERLGAVLRAERADGLALAVEAVEEIAPIPGKERLIVSLAAAG